MQCTGRRWQSRAVYKRLNTKIDYEYSIEDYIRQNVLRQLELQSSRASSALTNSKESQIWNAIATSLRMNEADEVKSIVKSFYEFINRRNFEQVQNLWLPDDSVEILLPGFAREVSS